MYFRVSEQGGSHVFKASTCTNTTRGVPAICSAHRLRACIAPLQIHAQIAAQHGVEGNMRWRPGPVLVVRRHT